MTDKTNVTIQVSRELHRRLKIEAAKGGVTLSALVAQKLKEAPQQKAEA